MDFASLRLDNFKVVHEFLSLSLTHSLTHSYTHTCTCTTHTIRDVNMEFALVTYDWLGIPCCFSQLTSPFAFPMLKYMDAPLLLCMSALSHSQLTKPRVKDSSSPSPHIPFGHHLFNYRGIENHPLFFYQFFYLSFLYKILFSCIHYQPPLFFLLYIRPLLHMNPKMRAHLISIQLPLVLSMTGEVLVGSPHTPLSSR